MPAPLRRAAGQAGDGALLSRAAPYSSWTTSIIFWVLSSMSMTSRST